MVLKARDGPVLATAKVPLGPAATTAFPAASVIADAPTEIPILVLALLHPVMLATLVAPVPLTLALQPVLIPVKVIAEATVVLVMVPKLESLKVRSKVTLAEALTGPGTEGLEMVKVGAVTSLVKLTLFEFALLPEVSVIFASMV